MADGEKVRKLKDAKNKLFKVFEGKNVLVTGNTGFKGSWLSLWLNLLGAKVIGISNNFSTKPQNFNICKLYDIIDHHELDIRDDQKLCKFIAQKQPDFIFHLAAQSLVKTSYEKPLETFQVNAQGSANILNAIRQLEKKVVCVMVTSDKVYENQEWVWGYKETDQLGGKDPYSASKAMAELAVKSLLNSFFGTSSNNKYIGIARVGNVIGGGDWAKNRIVPDCVRAWATGENPTIRSPKATRPWQHVLEPISGYLVLAENLYLYKNNHTEAFNFGPSSETVHSVLDLITEMKKTGKA